MVSSSRSQEFEGATVEEAIQKACQKMGVSRETITIKVLCEEQRGLFGMEGVSPAKIKVSIKQKKT